MELATLVVLVLVTVFALAFDFTNGFHDTANAMATSIATGALKPRTAVIIAGIMNLVGAFLSTEVAQTVSGGLINEQQVAIGPEIILAGLVGAIIWNLITWLLGLPSSGSHALFGGLVGAVMAAVGLEGVNLGAILTKVLVPSLISPVIAGIASLLIVKVIVALAKGADEESMGRTFRRGQTVTACLVALSHGTNDAQKTMGIITLALVTCGAQASGTAPQLWVVIICGVAIAAGTYMGGWRVIHTLGKGLTEIDSLQGFAAEAASAVSILASSHMGLALSTTQVCSGSIIGSGLGKGTKVRWSVAGRMAIAWLVTFPAAGLIAAGASLVSAHGLAGTIAVALVAAVGAAGIFMLSKRNPVDASNVTDDYMGKAAEESSPIISEG